MTNDGHAILREIDVKHPAAKSMIELSRAQVLLLSKKNVLRKMGDLY
jgi:hypothetical protein